MLLLTAEAINQNLLLFPLEGTPSAKCGFLKTALEPH